MTEVEEFIKTHNCSNCGQGLCSDIDRTNHVCTGWKPKPCKHDLVYAAFCSDNQWSKFPETVTLKCGLCDEKIVYTRERKCKDCGWFDKYKVAGMNFTQCGRHALSCPKEIDYCSRWEKK